MSKTWIVIITALITATVAVGATYYYLNNKAEEEKADLQDQIDELEQKVQDVQNSTSASADDDAETSATATTGETADWQTYTNLTYNFTINYPKDWKIDDNMQTSGSARIEDFLKIYKGDSFLRIYYDPAGWGMPAPEIIYEISEKNGLISLSNRSVNEATSEGVSSVITEGAIHFKKSESYALILNDGPYYIDAYSPNLEYEDEIVDVLSTLHFTE